MGLYNTAMMYCSDPYLIFLILGGDPLGCLGVPTTTSQTCHSPGGSQTKNMSHSAHTSPTNTAKLRPRASSAESDRKKIVSTFKIIIVRLYFIHPFVELSIYIYILFKTWPIL